MPTYEYRCEACDHNFDEFQSIMDEPLKKCPQCGKKKLRRVFGCGAAVLFKGSGFYETDYRSESYKSAAKSDQEAAKSVETKGADSSAASESSKSETSSNGTSGNSGKSSSKKAKSSA